MTFWIKVDNTAVFSTFIIMSFQIEKYVPKLINAKDVLFGLGGILLASLGVLMLLSSSNSSITYGQTGTPYTSNWTAQKLITVCCTVVNDNGTNKNIEIGIGVSEWLVIGTIDGEQAFTETWKTPNVSAVFTSTPNKIFAPDPQNSGFKTTDWLLGAVQTWGTFLTFRERSPSELLFAWRSKHLTSVGGNGGAVCTGSDIDCRFTSGAYGWTDGESIGRAGGSSQPRGGGIFMPLKWTVTGTIFD